MEALGHEHEMLEYDLGLTDEQREIALARLHALVNVVAARFAVRAEGRLDVVDAAPIQVATCRRKLAAFSTACARLAVSTSTLASWKARATSPRNCVSVSRWAPRPSSITAVFSPEKLNSRSPLAIIGRGSWWRPGAPDSARRASAGPPGSLESRTATTRGKLPATSTQF